MLDPLDQQRPVMERFVAEFGEPAAWPWVRDLGRVWHVVDIARGVTIRRGMDERRAVEHARFAHRYAPPIRGLNVHHQPVGLSGGYVFEVWGWHQCARWEDGSSGSAWSLEALCDARQGAVMVGAALLEWVIAHQAGPTSVEIWAPTSPTWPGTWECLERDELDPLAREILRPPRFLPGEPGPVMPWHEVAPNGSVPGVHVARSGPSDIPA